MGETLLQRLARYRAMAAARKAPPAPATPKPQPPARTPGVPMCYGYARASTGEQMDTLVIQQEAVKKAYDYRLQAKGFAWGGVFTDQGVSGGTEFARRPEGSKVDLALERGDAIIIAKLDRGFRSSVDFFTTLQRFRDRGIHLVMLDLDIDTSAPAGELIAGVLAVIGQFERRRIGERMKEFQAKRNREGRPSCGHAPYGQKIVGAKGNRNFAPDPYTRNIGRHIVRWRDSGWSWEAIYFHMLKHAIKTRLGKEWGVGGIKDAYAGEVRLQREEAQQQEGKTNGDQER